MKKMPYLKIQNEKCIIYNVYTFCENDGNGSKTLKANKLDLS